MDFETAIAFLQKHQPLPNDVELNSHPEILETYDEVRKYFLAHRHSACIPLLLNSFGGRNGFVIYQLVGDVLDYFDHQLVVEYLAKCLDRSRAEYNLYWNIQICISFPDALILPHLLRLIDHVNPDIRIGSITALEQIGGESVRNELTARLLVEVDEDVRELLRDVIKVL